MTTTVASSSKTARPCTALLLLSFVALGPFQAAYAAPQTEPPEPPEVERSRALWCSQCIPLPDGRIAAVACDDGTVRLFDLESGRTLRILRGHREKALSVVPSPQGDILATSSADKTLCVWDLEDGRLSWSASLPRGLHTYWGHTLRFAPDGSKIVAARGGDARVWDVQTGREILALPQETRTQAADWSPDSRTLASVGEDGYARLWDTTTGEETRPALEHLGPLRTVAFHPDGFYLVTGGLGATASLWNLRSGELVAAEGFSDGLPLSQSIQQLIFTPDGTELVITTGGHWSVHLCYAYMLQERWQIDLEGGTPAPMNVAFDAEGGRLALSRVPRIVSRKGRPLASLDEDLEDLRFSPGDRYVIARRIIPSADSLGSHSATVVLDGETFAPLYERTEYPAGSTVSYSVKVVVDGETLAPIGEYPQYPEATEVAPPEAHCWGPCTPLSDGRTAAVVSSDGTVRLFDLESGRTRRVLEGPGVEFLSAVPSPTENLLATLSMDKTLRLWDLEEGDISWSASLEWGERTPWRLTLRFAPDGSKIVAVCGGDTCVWDVETGREVLRFPQEKKALAVDWSPDSRTLAGVGWDGYARLWDVASGKETGPALVHSEPLWTVSFHPDGVHLATGGRGPHASLWDVVSGELVATGRFGAGGPPETELIHQVLFTPDGADLVITTGGIWIVYLCDARTLQRRWHIDFEGGSPAPMTITLDCEGTRLALSTIPQIVSRDGRTRTTLEDLWDYQFSPEDRYVIAGRTMRLDDGSKGHSATAVLDGESLTPLYVRTEHPEGATISYSVTVVLDGETLTPLDEHTEYPAGDSVIREDR